MEDRFPVLQTQRLLLRAPRPDDAREIYEIHAQSKFMPWYGGDPLPEITSPSGEDGLRWMLQGEEGTLLGTCALFDWRRDWQGARLDFALSHAVRGKGLMREALVAVLRHGFAAMRLHRVECQVHQLNLAPMRLLRSLGFVQEGSRREAGFWDGTRHDLLVYGLLRPEFKPG